ncbi:ornithine cyclodeaminase family protein [Glacieibacterium sp.]|uniref:ornithine cyclodeaminase family protein n=1 Tax=Glacieibacterium sp. TaxID=2860237 RepID=UPI003B00E413
MRFIDAAEVRAGLGPDDCIAVVRAAMMALSAGETIQSPRAVLSLGRGNKFGVMPAALSAQGMFGAKLVGVFGDAAHPGRQAHRGVVVLFDGDNGQPVCVVDAEEITLARTAAASAVATDCLARADATTLAIFGSGAQAEAHVLAIARVRALTRVTIWGRSLANASLLAARLAAATGLEVVAEADGETAARADIVCTVTTSAEPVLFSDWVADGTHVNLVGSSRPGPVEIDRALLLRGRYIADSRAQVLLEAAEFLNAKAAGDLGDDHIVGEIGEVLLGRVVGRRTASEVTIYKSLGHPVQDLAAAAFLYARS